MPTQNRFIYKSGSSSPKEIEKKSWWNCFKMHQISINQKSALPSTKITKKITDTRKVLRVEWLTESICLIQ